MRIQIQMRQGCPDKLFWFFVFLQLLGIIFYDVGNSDALLLMRSFEDHQYFQLHQHLMLLKHFFCFFLRISCIKRLEANNKLLGRIKNYSPDLWCHGYKLFTYIDFHKMRKHEQLQARFPRSKFLFPFHYTLGFIIIMMPCVKINIKFYLFAVVLRKKTVHIHAIVVRSRSRRGRSIVTWHRIPSRCRSARIDNNTGKKIKASPSH